MNNDNMHLMVQSHHYGGDAVPSTGAAFEAHEPPAMNFASTNVTPSTGYDGWCDHGYPTTTTYHDSSLSMDASSYSNGEISALHFPYENGVYQKDQMTSSDTMSSTGSILEEKQGCEGPDATSRISPDTILMPMVRRGRPTENPCWSYFHRIDDQLVRCRICTKIVKSACATNMTKHLERHHSGDYEKLSEQIRLYRLNDATFRTKLQYLTHMNPPGSQESAPNGYMVSGGKLGEHYEPQMPLHQPAHGYYAPDPMCVGYNVAQFGDEWQLSHFWPPAELHQTPPPPPTAHFSHDATPVVQVANEPAASSSSSSEAAVVVQGVGRKGGVVAKAKGAGQQQQQWVSSGNERPYMKRNRKTEHPVWEYFKRTGDGNAECTICTGVVKSPCSSNFMRHLMRHHTNEYNDVYMKWVQKRNTTSITSSTTQLRVPESYNS